MFACNVLVKRVFKMKIKNHLITHKAQISWKTWSRKCTHSTAAVKSDALQRL